jgi:hypothetical protein
MKRTPSHRRKCLSCRHVFSADYRNGHHQRYCSQPQCRKASKKASPRRWRRKPENRACDCGEARVLKVQAWRKRHPGYWKRQSKPISAPQPTDSQSVNPEPRSPNATTPQISPLRDLCLEKNPVFVGLLSMVTGSTLRDDIAATSRQRLLMGENILGLKAPGATPESPNL